MHQHGYPQRGTWQTDAVPQPASLSRARLHHPMPAFVAAIVAPIRHGGI